jgi:aminopeptidase N
MTERRAVLSGFRHPGQDSALAPYDELYFETVLDTWMSGEREFALAFTRFLYPRDAMDEERVLNATDAILDDSSTPADLVRMLREERARLAMARTARRFDTEAMRTEAR